MKNKVKKLLGIKALEEYQISMNEAMAKIEADIKKNIAITNSNIEKSQKFMDKMDKDIAEVDLKVSCKMVNKKFKGWTSEHEFYQLSTRIYVLDNGNPKKNAPFVATDSSGVHDDYKSEVGPESKMRCFMLTKLVLVGYGNKEDYLQKGAERNNYKHYFGKTYRELVAYMYEYNYEKLDEGICTLNFYEI